MVHTVGLYSANGGLGAPTARHLVKAANEGKIKAVLFSRPSSGVKGISPGPNVEIRALDLSGPAADIEKAVAGINVFIGSIAVEAIMTETALIGALAKSPDMVTYIPSIYSIPWGQPEFDGPEYESTRAFTLMAQNTAKERGVATTSLYTGGFHTFWFDEFFGQPIKKNQLQADKTMLANKFAVSSLEHLGAALADIASRDPHTIKSKTFSAVSFWPTGQELADLYSKLNGSPAAVEDYTDEVRQALLDSDDPEQTVRTGYFKLWQKGEWGYSGEQIPLPKGSASLEELAIEFLKQ